MVAAAQAEKEIQQPARAQQDEEAAEGFGARVRACRAQQASAPPSPVRLSPSLCVPAVTRADFARLHVGPRGHLQAWHHQDRRQQVQGTCPSPSTCAHACSFDSACTVCPEPWQEAGFCTIDSVAMTVKKNLSTIKVRRASLWHLRLCHFSAAHSTCPLLP